MRMPEGPLMRLERWPWVWQGRSCIEPIGGSDRSPRPSCREIPRDHVLLQPCPEPDEGGAVPGRDGLGLRTQARRYPQGGAASARLSGHQPEWQGAGDHRPGHWGEGVDGAVLVDALNVIVELVAREGIECRERLVHEQHPRIGRATLS